MRGMWIDYTFRNREESEKYWNEPIGINSRLLRVLVTLGVIVVTPIELVCEAIIIILGLIARVGSLVLWSTNPIGKEKQTESKEES